MGKVEGAIPYAKIDQGTRLLSNAMLSLFGLLPRGILALWGEASLGVTVAGAVVLAFVVGGVLR